MDFDFAIRRSFQSTRQGPYVRTSRNRIRNFSIGDFDFTALSSSRSVSLVLQVDKVVVVLRANLLFDHCKQPVAVRSRRELNSLPLAQELLARW